MRKYKKYIILPVMMFAFTFILCKVIGVSYSALNQNYEYKFIRRNMISHHFISGNGGNESGTILLKTGSLDSNSGTPVLVYCAKQGKKITGSKGFSKNSISDIFDETKSKKLKAILSNSYPYISLAELKEVLKDENIGIGSDVYADNLFDTLDVQEAITATQAALWNVIEDKVVFGYEKTKKLSKISYINFNHRREVDWEKCSSYNFQGHGAKSTILQEGDTTSSVCSYKANGTPKLKSRINELILWYLALESGEENFENNILSFEYSNASWSEDGKTLTVDIKATGNFDYSNSNYTISFNDLNGNKITDSNIIKTEILENNVLKGYKYVITGIVTKGLNVSISAINKGKPQDVYYYLPKNRESQAMIGIDNGDTLITNELKILNEGSGEITIYKVKDSKSSVSLNDSNERNLCSQNENCLEGAYIALYASNKTTIIKEFISSYTKPETITDLPEGTYYIKELTPPVGYLLNEEFYEVKLEKNAKATVVINNEPTKICFKKVSSEDNSLLLDNAVFRVEGAGGGTYEVFKTSSQFETQCIEGQLESGYYYLIEEEAPKNYAKTNTIFKFKVGKFNPEDIIEEIMPEYQENVVLIESVNNIITIENDPGVVISKTDISTGACVEGAKLIINDKDGNTIDSWISSCSSGKDSYQLNLEPGTYTLTEVIAPKGYATSETIEFTIDSNGKVDKVLNMKDAPIEVCFHKISKDSEEGLPGAEFEIYNEDGTLYNKFITNYLPTCFPYMPIGNYIVKETKAPEGYKITNKEIKITVKDTSERQLFEIENEIEAPKTAKDYSKIIVIVASIFMFFGLGLVGYHAFKKQV